MERWCVALIPFIFAVPAQAGPTRAELLAAPCFACHGTASGAEGDIPRLDIEAEKIRVKMVDFKDEDARTTIMTRIARGYTEREIEMIADYIGGKR